MPLAPGTRLGSFEIAAPIGAGGMGEVYRAHDRKLARDVAIKVLPEAVARDPERLARFEREAKLLAALNHANVAAIYGLEESDGVRFLVLELVPGDTLAERLAAGPLPTEDALAVARGIAEALEAAHVQGIVHRDLKPANVKVTPSGKVKVLDFGLAKMFGGDGTRSQEVSHSPTITSGGTQQGVILGTAAYMSPEQARGKPVDRRTDVWSFGCVLYEMLTGRKAFEGETVSDVMVSVLTREPDWGAVPPGVPAGLVTVIRRCLRKDPERRLRDVADANLEIEEAASETVGTDPVPIEGKARGRRRLTLLATGLACAAVGAIAAAVLAHRPAAAASPRIARISRLTPPTGRAEWPAWSADGSLIAYASNRSGDFEIYVRRGEAGQDIDVTNDPGQDIQPAFSPDGNAIAFVSTRSSRTGLIKIGGSVLSRGTRTYGGDLWIVPTLGGPARRLAPDANYPAWRPDGRRVLYVTGRESHRAIMEISADGTAPRAVLPESESRWEILWVEASPDGRWVSFEDQLEAVYLMPAAGGKPTRVLSGFSHRWDATSRRLWALEKGAEGGTLVRSDEIDPESGVVRGAPRTVGVFTAYLRDLAVARDGSRVVVTEDENSRNLTRQRLSPDGGTGVGPEEPLSSGRVIDSYPQVSHDGRRIAYISDTVGRSDVWILDLETQRRQRFQLPSDYLAAISPAWMPGDKELVLAQYLKAGESSGWIASLDGSRADEIVRSESRSVFLMRPSPDGRSVLFTEIQGSSQLERYDLATRTRATLTNSPGETFDAEWSPDGKWIALTASAGDATQLFRLPASGGTIQQLTTGHERVRHPFYSPDGKWIYVQPSHRNICRVRAEGGPLEQVTGFPEAGLFLEEPAISPDGKYLYYCRENGGSSLWLMTLANRGGSP